MRLAASARLGVLGGTFDPPHIGHLVAALEVRYALRLDWVLLVVANQPWQKEGDLEHPATREVSPPEARLAMTRAAVEGLQGLEVSDIEIARGGATYTVDTLEQLTRLHPDAALFLILGSDAAAQIESWRQPTEVAELAHLVVVDRGDTDAALPAGFEWQRVRMPHLEISSTDLRARIADGRPTNLLIPEAVRSCIDRLGLYRWPDHD